MNTDNVYVYKAYEAYKERTLGCPELLDLSLSELIRIRQDAKHLKLVDNIRENQAYIDDCTEAYQ